MRAGLSEAGNSLVSLIAIQKLGRNRENLRLWIESQRLDQLGFCAGTPLQVESQRESLTLRPAILAENHVSSHAVAGGRRPIIDLANQSLLAGLSEYSELKIIASFERIQVTPSRRAFAIHRSSTLQPLLRVLEVFAGGGTMTGALPVNSLFAVTAGVEINPDYADEWQARHARATLFQCDIRALQPAEFPDFDVLIGGIPCTSHSNLGRAKKGLAGRPELGDTGDLFLPVVALFGDWISQMKPSQQFVHEWNMEDLLSALEQINSGRLFESGRDAFRQTGCSQCHRFAGEGGSLGPDLTGVGRRLSPHDLLESILLPSKIIAEGYATTGNEPKSGGVIHGHVEREDDRAALIRPLAATEEVVTIRKTDIRHHALSMISNMTTGIINTLSETQVLDLLAYLIFDGDSEHAAFRSRPAATPAAK